MQSPAAILPRLWRWLVRFRHRRGYGIHSPFAFSFVTDVIYERGEYYAYAPLSTICPEHGERPLLRRRDLRLLFRIANASGAQEVLLAAHDAQRVKQYVAAARPRARLHTAAPDSGALRDALHDLHGIHLAYAEAEALDRSTVELLLAAAEPNAYIVLHGIHRNAASRKVWGILRADSRTRVTFDLHDFGIACLEARLNKEDYIINYF